MSNFVRGARTPACSVHTRVNASEVGQPIPAVIPKHFVLQPIPFFARRDDFVGQVGNLRPIGNRPACSARNSGPTPASFAARRYVGRVGKTCGRLSKSACRYHPKSSRRQRLSFAACRYAGQITNLDSVGINRRPSAARTVLTLKAGCRQEWGPHNLFRRLGWIFIECLLHHVVQFALHLGSIAFVLTSDRSPD